jgi:hypothetical protein
MSDSEDSDSATGSTPKTHFHFSSSDEVIAAISICAEQLSEKRASNRCSALGKLRDIMSAHNCCEELENWKESLSSSFVSCFKSGGEEEQLLVLKCSTLFVITLAPEDQALAELLASSFLRNKSAFAPLVAANLMLFRCCVCWMHCDLRATSALMGEVSFYEFFLQFLQKLICFHFRFCHTSLLRQKVLAVMAIVWPSYPHVGACLQPLFLLPLQPPLPQTLSVGFSLL